MTTLALVLILISACLHATWNLLTKRLPGGSESVWLFTAVAVIVYAPLAGIALLVTGFGPNAQAWLFMLGTGGLQMIYFTLLRRGYAAGDLSVVYPLARGTGPLVAVSIATIVIGERPSPVTVLGAMIVSSGTFMLATPLRGKTNHRVAVGYGLATGLAIGCYTAWDGYAVSELAIPALVYDWVGRVGLLAWLTPVAARRREAIRATWATHRRVATTIGILSSGSYILVLTAMSIVPISSIAPAREISIVIGTIMGMVVLQEAGGPRRIAAATIIAIGVLAVALG